MTNNRLAYLPELSKPLEKYLEESGRKMEQKP